MAVPLHHDPTAPALYDLLVDPAAQLRCLADLVDRGLISREEFDEVKLRVLRPLR